MKGIFIEERAVKLAHYIIETKETVRSTAKTFGISKSTVHKDVTLKNGKENRQVIPKSIEIKKVRILKKGLKIMFINPNTEEQIVQAMAGVLAYNLAENDNKIKFDYNNSNTYQNSHKEIEDEELEL